MKLSRCILQIFEILFLTTVCITCVAQNKIRAISIDAAADNIEQKVIAWRHDFHKHPELGNQEFRTAEIVAKHLQSVGIEVQTKVGVTGVVGILKGGKPGPVVALRADMDGLPVEEKNDLPFASKAKGLYKGAETPVMHACGHDGHVAILMGVAEILAGMRKDLKGTVKFIFQPAEEGVQNGEIAGAALMIKEGVLENPKVDVIFALHLDAQTEVGKITYRPGGAMAGVGKLKIVVHGKPSHGAQPWLAVDPIVVSAQIINNLQTIVSRNANITLNPVVVTIGSIHGGNRDNIISESVEMIGTVRTFSEADEKLVYRRIKEIAEHTAKSAGATAEALVPFEHYYPVTFNNEKLTADMIPSLQKAAGKENVFLVPPETGAEDFAFFAQKVPGLYVFVGGLPKGQDPKTSGPHHTPQFFLDDGSFKTGVKTLCNLVVDYVEMKDK
jgi:amidohydrolase